MTCCSKLKWVSICCAPYEISKMESVLLLTAMDVATCLCPCEDHKDISILMQKGVFNFSRETVPTQYTDAHVHLLSIFYNQWPSLLRSPNKRNDCLQF